MTDVKMVRVDKVAIGSSSDVAENIIRFSTRLVSPDGALVEPIPVINEFSRWLSLTVPATGRWSLSLTATTTS